jgi:hypothetical protein
MQLTSLNSVEQNEIERLALKLILSPRVLHQKELSRRQLLSDPVASSADGMATLDHALDNLAYAAALGGANGDPTRPQVIWTLAASRDSFGHSVPGSRYLIDNPDTVYRFVTVDGTSQYEITVRAKQPGPAQFSFMLHDTMFSENTKKSLADLDQPIAGLRDIDIERASDGSFKVFVDSEPANGRTNHLRSNADARIIWIRNSLAEWGAQNPHEIRIKRVGGPPAPQPFTEADMAQLAAAILEGGINWLLALMNRTFAHVDEPNVVSKVFGRGGAWGYAARANFKLQDDEGLMVDIAPTVPNRYVGFQLTDPWQVSREYIAASGSLNNAQAVQNPDGGYSYVVSANDPGINNWLDTGGLHEGGLLIRWQTLPDTPAALAGAVRKAQVVKLRELMGLLPAGTSKVSSDQRKLLREQRAGQYAHRYLAGNRT